ncbi:MAG: hypothetical protein U0Q12_20260 [Vicinamibacterales bacterium]
MSWQDMVVACVVLGAVVFLGRRMAPARPSSGTSTFVPLSKLKRRSAAGARVSPDVHSRDRSGDAACH